MTPTPIEIFPPGLSGSVITCVWVGLLVVAFFNLRLGWVLSGLVVPGYLVPLLILKPWSVLAIFVEAIVTYGLVWTYSERLNRLGLWSAVFGRDRFFALLVTSVAVRLVFDGWAFPAIGDWVNAHYAVNLDFNANLHSFGLVIVTLIANLFWKPGLVRGLAGVVTILGVTFAIVHFGLEPWTNFSLTRLQYIYEDLAASLLASPKAYIILLSAAFIASRMNLHYGWEYSGILIPSLLALQWYQPVKLLTSFVEAFIILMLAGLLLRTPLLRHANIEGSRKLVLFFNIGYAYKWLLALAVVTWFPYVKVTDAFAYGYLLATLMAIKMHDKEVAGVLTRANLQTSLVAVAVATAVGYFLSTLSAQLPASHAQAPASTPPPPRAVARAQPSELLPYLRAYKPDLYARNRRVPTPTPDQLATFDRALDALDRFLETRRPGHLDAARERLGAVGYDLTRLEGRYLVLHERDPLRGWGLYVVDTHASGTLAIEVPAPANERGTLDAGAWLFRLQGARTLSLAGAPRQVNPDRSADVLFARDGFFTRFHRRFGDHDTLQVRGYTAAVRRQWLRVRQARAEPGTMPPPSLWVLDKLPASLDLERLERAVQRLTVLWQPTDTINRQRDLSGTGFAELFLDPDALRALFVASIGGGERTRGLSRAERIDGYLQRWLLEGKGRIAGRGSEAYARPALEALFYFDEEILTPLMHVAARTREPDWDGQQLPPDLDTVASAAYVMGYRLVRYQHLRTGEQYLLLQERFDDPSVTPRHWGTYVFRLGPSSPLVVEIPRPLFERHSFEYGVSLFERVRARLLLIAGAHPLANADGSADPVRIENTASVFNLAHQVALRESWEEPLTALQIRAFVWKPHMGPQPPDVMMASGAGIPTWDPLPPAMAQLLELLRRDGLSLVPVEGTSTTAGYEATSLPQALYADTVPHKAFYAVWLSPDLRAVYRQQAESRLQLQAFRVLGLENLEWDLPQELPRRVNAKGSAPLPGGLRRLLAAYVEQRDIAALRNAQRQWPHYRLARVVDLESRQAFLLVGTRDGRPAALANLSPVSGASEVAPSRPLEEQTVRDFVEARTGWLILHTP